MYKRFVRKRERIKKILFALCALFGILAIWLVVVFTF